MATTAAILSLISTVLGIGFWLIKRKAASNDDPIEQHRKEVLRAEGVLAAEDGARVAVELNDALSDLERLQISQGVERAGGDAAGEGGANGGGHQ